MARSKGFPCCRPATILDIKTKTITIEDEPVIFCGEIKCRNKAMSLVEKRAEKLTAAHNAPALAYGCEICGKHLVKAEMFKCSRCKSVIYCSKACQTKHWKTGGHREECEPM